MSSNSEQKRSSSSLLGRTIRSIPSHVAEALVEDVVQGVLPPGSRLKEIDLSERFGVSRTAIREAISILERDGYAERIPRMGARIRVAQPGEIEELFHIRAWLLGLAARRIAEHGSDEFLDSLRLSIEKVIELAADPATTPKRYADFVLALHTRIMQETGWRHLGQLFEAMSSQASWQVSVRGPSTSFLTPERRRQSSDSWARLNKALQARNPQEAEGEARTMLLDSYRTSVGHIQSRPA